jgi:DNA-binding NarL/FixJ family response regulator
MLHDIGADAFAERARRELLATGETTRERIDVTRDALTPQESQISRLAAEGRTNPEIGSELFISDTTVKTHVTRLLQKLELRDRAQAIVLAYQTGLFEA